MYRLQLYLFSCLLVLPLTAISANNDDGNSDQSEVSDQLLGFDKAELDLLISSTEDKPKKKGDHSTEIAIDDLDLEQQALLQELVADSKISKSQSVPATPPSIGMLTGDKKSTYYPIGSDIAKLAAAEGLIIDVKASSGTLDNIRRMSSNENAGLAIVQSDVIEFLSDGTNQVNQSIVSNLRPVFPLYNEEVHLLVKRDIKKPADLSNKRVIVGELGTGTPITANMVFDKLGVDIEPVTNVAPDKALKQFLLGGADAIFFVGGKPISYLNGLLEMRNNKSLRKYTEGIHLLPLDDERLHDIYTKTEITPGDYQSQNGLYRLTEAAVPTVAAQAILVSFDFSKNSSPYYKQRCKQINQLNSIVRNSLEKMASGGGRKYHAKWSQVDLDQPTKLPQNHCISDATPIVNELKAMDCYLQTGRPCE